MPLDAVYKALADPTRRRILALLRERDMTAGELADAFELSKPTLSGHFSVLKAAGLIDGEKQGTSITYRLQISVLEEALLGLMNSLDIGMRPRGRTTRARKVAP
ncbi:MAG: winged helix-turn-helix transcriptional regulator [Deltaproteobacteria bacterium]|nr:winged helix-turn-helix transcriptional regulator [Deltaproteobacteria bacterium]MBK8240164.1 winged helix-turn-helix transcriptional regulator [Deltaproteobacteria bacterium]MBK8715848.1 winged helix-turn-helix transcriptional regulator [Deltaproteobacteria bacterium]MBP7286578.1 winged helix-turn-helix transcriptional regulator [Nannocystaceae bacterium]